MTDIHDLASAILDLAEKDKGLTRLTLEELLDDHLGPPRLAMTEDMAKAWAVHWNFVKAGDRTSVSSDAEVCARLDEYMKATVHVPSGDLVKAGNVFIPSYGMEERDRIISEAITKYDKEIESWVQCRLDQGYKLTEIKVEKYGSHTDIVAGDMVQRVFAPKFKMNEEQDG